MTSTPDLPDMTTAIAKFQSIPTGLVTDALGRLGLGGWMDAVVPVAPTMRFVGRARTAAFGPVRRAGTLDTNMYARISELEAGDVLVMATGRARAGENMLGDNMAAQGKRFGLAGIVTDSGARDFAGLREVGLPVFCRGPAVRPPSGIELRALDVDVDCGGAQVRPGDLLVGDEDGIVVVPADRVDDILYQIEDLKDFERGMEMAILHGGTNDDIAKLLKIKKTVKPRPGS